MRNFDIPVTFSFSGTFKIKARNIGEAIEHAQKHCGMTTERGIHSSLPCEDVDWDFPCHPEKTIDW